MQRLGWIGELLLRHISGADLSLEKMLVVTRSIMKSTMKSQILQLLVHLFVLSTISAAAAIRYVNVNSTSPAPPYTNWTTATTTIQDAVDAAVAGDQILVTNGIYQTGGRAVFGAMTNRVAVNKPVTVQSVNGAAVTVIRGFQMPDTTNGDSAIRCVYLTNGAALVGFTLTNGATRSSGDQREQGGGGVWCESASAVVSNCVLTANSAGNGGGAYRGTLDNCTLSGNSAYYGGGALNCTLNNCTLTGNSARGNGGGAYVGTLNNCTLTANSAYGYGGGANGATLNNCTLSGNSVTTDLSGGGGGASGGTLNNCILTGNSAESQGGGANDATLNNCTLSANSARYEGGGVHGGVLNNCTLTGNSATAGGGASSGTLNNCTLMRNYARYEGGGVFGGVLINCTLTGNSAADNGGGACGGTLNNCTVTGNSAFGGGGAFEGTLNNCTVTGNSAMNSGGGVSGCTLNNCIVYYNSAPKGDNYSASSLSYSCTTPLPPGGVGNISAEPQLADLSHLSAGSPCRGAGSTAYATGLDIDGETWAKPPSIGCDEYHPGVITGPLTVSIQDAYTNVIMGYKVNSTAAIAGRATANRWEFGDGTSVSNRLSASHSWVVVGGLYGGVPGVQRHLPRAALAQRRQCMWWHSRFIMSP